MHTVSITVLFRAKEWLKGEIGPILRALSVFDQAKKREIKIEPQSEKVLARVTGFGPIEEVM